MQKRLLNKNYHLIFYFFVIIKNNKKLYTINYNVLAIIFILHLNDLKTHNYYF